MMSNVFARLFCPRMLFKPTTPPAQGPTVTEGHIRSILPGHSEKRPERPDGPSALVFLSASQEATHVAI